MGRIWMLPAAMVCAVPVMFAQTRAAEAPAQLVRDVVYNELHDHDTHGFWRYWVTKQKQNQKLVEDQVETADGPVSRLMQSNGKPLTADARRQEDARMTTLLGSTQEQARHRQEYQDDERRIGHVVALLPDAFLYDYDGEENGSTRLKFRPNPDYPARSMEAKVFHAMRGTLWIDSRYKRMVRMQGSLEEDVDFGFGLLGSVNRGGWFDLQRKQVSGSDWKTDHLEVHMSGRALFFKTIAHETSEERGGFTRVPAGMSFAQGMHMLLPEVAARVSPTSFRSQH